MIEYSSNIKWISEIDQTWTLFLDRDGVINDEFEESYVLNWDMFHFLDGALESFSIFAMKFSKIIIVTNQKGVGKGIMSKNDLEDIHSRMTLEIQNHGGRIDKIYYCTDIEESSPNRKPNIGMAMLAKNDFPMIDLHKSIMVGNNISDMEFGMKAGMKNIFIRSKKSITDFSATKIDAIFNGINELAKAL